jgi:hypothetical protein
VALVRGGHEHAKGLDAHHVAGLQVAQNDHEAALQLLLRHVAHETAADLPHFRLANVNFFHIQLVSLRVLPRLVDLAHPDVQRIVHRARVTCSRKCVWSDSARA